MALTNDASANLDRWLFICFGALLCQVSVNRENTVSAAAEGIVCLVYICKVAGLHFIGTEMCGEEQLKADALGAACTTATLCI